MAVPSTGPLGLYEDIWNAELGGTQGNNSLHSASVYAGFSTPDAMSDFYGWSDVEVPGVTTNAMSTVEYYRMFANGTVNTTGNENPDRGFYFGTNSAASTNNTKYSVGVGGTGAFSRNMDAQVNAYNTTYYGWAYAGNSAGEAQGGRVQATTPYPPFSPSTVTLQYFCGFAGSCNSNFSAGGYTGYVNPYSGGLAAVNSFNFLGFGSCVQGSNCNTFTTNAKTAAWVSGGPWGWGAMTFRLCTPGPYQWNMSSLNIKPFGFPGNATYTCICSGVGNVLAGVQAFCQSNNYGAVCICIC